MSFPPPPPSPPIILSHRPRRFRNCFRPFLLLLRLPLAGEFRVPSVTTYFTGVFSSFSSASPSLSLVCFLHCSSFSSPCCLAPQAGIYFSTPLAPSFGLSRFLLPSALSFILEMGIGIHETKLMITTSKQRAERPTATCRAIYKSHSSLTSLFHLSPIQLFR